MNKKHWLTAAAALSLVVAIFQALISLSPSLSLYFGAPAEVAANRGLLLVMGEAAAVIFLIFSLYAFSAAGRIRPLPLLHLGLITITALYILRGLLFIPALLILMGWLEGQIPIQALFSSLVSLDIGVVYLLGVSLNWQDIPPRFSR